MLRWLFRVPLREIRAIMTSATLPAKECALSNNICAFNHQRKFDRSDPFEIKSLEVRYAHARRCLFDGRYLMDRFFDTGLISDDKKIIVHHLLQALLERTQSNRISSRFEEPERPLFLVSNVHECGSRGVTTFFGKLRSLPSPPESQTPSSGRNYDRQDAMLRGHLPLLLRPRRVRGWSSPSSR